MVGSVAAGSAAVLGGGPAGASAALLLARAGRDVHLFERQAGPHHKICGEFLSVEAQRDLRAMAFEPLRLGAVAIDRVRIVSGSATVEARLPFTGLGVSRLVMDEALLEAAQAAGAHLRRGEKVLSIDDCAVHTTKGRFEAETLLLATGKHDLRGARRPSAERPGRRADYLGFKMHWRISAEQEAALGNAVELVACDHGYLGLQRVAPRVMNFCALIRRDGFTGSWPALLAELARQDHIARRLDGATDLFARPCTVAGLPYGQVQRPADDRAGLFRLGDQAALTAPLTGDGMAIALRSAALAAESLLAGMGSADYTRRLRREVGAQVRKAMLLHRLASLPLTARLAAGLLGFCPPLLGRMAAATRLQTTP